MGSVSGSQGYYSFKTRAEPKSSNQHFPVSRRPSGGDHGANPSSGVLKVSALPAAARDKGSLVSPGWPFVFHLSTSNQCPGATSSSGRDNPARGPLAASRLHIPLHRGKLAPATLPRALPVGKHTALTSLTGQAALVKLLYLLGLIFVLYKIGNMAPFPGLSPGMDVLGPGFEL